MRLLQAAIVALCFSCNSSQGSSSFSVPAPVRPNVVGAVMHPKGEGGKDFEVIVDKPFDRTTIYYRFAFLTKNGKQLEDTGIFIHNGVTGVNGGTSVRHNVYLFVRRGDPPDRWKTVDEQLSPGNIESVTIELAAGSGGFKEADVFSRGTFHNL